jgi:serine protease inhibitor
MINKKASATLIAVIVVAAVAVAATSLYLYPYEPNNPPNAIEEGSTSEGIQQVVDANNQFAFELYNQLNTKETGNMFYSPYSMSAALAMTYEGAKGQTAEEMKSVFHFPETNTLRPNFAAIYNEINKEDKQYQLSTGNALWVQQDYSFLGEYTGTIEDYYGGKATNLDFIYETEKSRQTINSFIEEQTNNKIKDLIPQGVLTSDARIVLTNAIYFKGTWEWEFDKSDTRERNFFVTPDNPVQTQMMHMNPDEATFNYADLENLQIIELPYKGNDVSMLILLPKQGEEYDYETGEMISYDYTLEDIELTAEKLEDYKSQMQEKKLDAINLPKFEFDTKYTMNQHLINLGMPTAFTGNADFSGMTGKKDLYIAFVIHQAYVKMDEEGTEAAAATAVGGFATSAGPSHSIIFNADHPFLFIIQEKQTGNILFMGRVVDPTA